MPESQNLRLVSMQPEARRTAARSRYLIHISDRGNPIPSVRVYDRNRRRVLLRWRGEAARRMLERDALPLKHMPNGSHDCDKALMQRIALDGSLIAMQLGTAAKESNLVDRNASGLHYLVAGLLFDYPDKQLGLDEITCLMLLQFPHIPCGDVQNVLDDLVRWGVVRTSYSPICDSR